jgi:hypothetical protein
MKFLLLKTGFGYLGCVEWNGSIEHADEIEAWTKGKTKCKSNLQFKLVIEVPALEGSHYTLFPGYWLIKKSDDYLKVYSPKDFEILRKQSEEIGWSYTEEPVLIPTPSTTNLPRVTFPASVIPRKLGINASDIPKDEWFKADVLGVTTHTVNNPMYKEGDMFATKEHMVTYFVVGLDDGSIIKIPSFNCRYVKA